MCYTNIQEKKNFYAKRKFVFSRNIQIIQRVLSEDRHAKYISE